MSLHRLSFASESHDHFIRAAAERQTGRRSGLERGAGGRYAVGSGNSIPSYIPVENYLAMVDEALGMA